MDQRRADTCNIVCMEELHHPSQPPTGTLVSSSGVFRLTQVQPPPMTSGCAFFFPGGSLRHRGAPAADCGHRRQRSNGVAGGRGCGLPGLQCLPFLHQTFSSLFSFFSSYRLPSTLSPTHPRVRSKSFWVPLLWTKDTHSLLFLHSLSCVQVLLVTTTVDQGHA